MIETKFDFTQELSEDVLIKVSGLYKYFDKVRVLKGVSCNIKKGEKVVIIGPSGSGKSTFLRCMNLLETPTYGEIWFENKLLTPVDPYIHKNIIRNANTYKALYQTFKAEEPELDDDSLDAKIIAKIKADDLLKNW